MKRTDSIRRTAHLLSTAVLALLLLAIPTQLVAAVPDPVLEWIGIMNTTVLTGGTNPLATSRVVALVSGSVFDAVNGINPLYKPLHVPPHAPASASQRAARGSSRLRYSRECLSHTSRLVGRIA